jgi:hypothetical protein
MEIGLVIFLLFLLKIEKKDFENFDPTLDPGGTPYPLFFEFSFPQYNTNVDTIIQFVVQYIFDMFTMHPLL